MRVPAIADAAYQTVTTDTVERAIQLTVTQRLERGIYYVTGGYEPHWVNLYDPTMPRCDCYDHTNREKVCKHMVAVLITVACPRLLRRLHQLRTQAQQGVSGVNGGGGG